MVISRNNWPMRQCVQSRAARLVRRLGLGSALLEAANPHRSLTPARRPHRAPQTTSTAPMSRPASSAPVM
jgi:hypothetical protein